MDDLIEALVIFRKYTDERWPTHCEHDVMYVCVDPDAVSDADKAKLDELSFIPSDDEECFASYRFGSA